MPLDLIDPVLRAKKDQQRRYVHQVVQEHADAAALVPWMADEPVGAEVLRRLAGHRFQATDQVEKPDRLPGKSHLKHL